MLKKIRRPLRIFTKADVPYIIYKDKKYNIKSTEIKDIIKFINKLQKKTTKKIQTENKPKKDIKKYINEKIKLEGGPSTQNVSSNQNIEKDTFKINDLNKEIEKQKQEIKAIEKEKKNDIKIINNIKAIEEQKIDELIKFDKSTNKYNLITNKLFIEGDNIDDVKNKLDEGYVKLDNDINDLQIKQNELSDNIDSLEKQKQNLKLETELKSTIYEKNLNKLEGEKKNIEQEKENFQSLTKLQQQSILNKQQKLQEKEQELLNKQKDIDRKQRYINYDKNYTTKQLNDVSRGLFNIDRDSTAQFTTLYHNFYNLQDQPKYQKTQKVNKEDYINFILDKEDQNTQGNGKKINDFGLWNYQIDKIMEPFKLYIKTITLDELDDMIKYIYNNKILIGSFILNIGNHWTAIYYDFTNEFVLEYYDPFGEPPKSIIIKLFKDLILKFNIEVFVKFKINRIQQQNIKTSNCGWFSMYYLIMRYNNYTFKYITKFKSVKQEEQNIEQLKDKYDKFGFI